MRRLAVATISCSLLLAGASLAVAAAVPWGGDDSGTIPSDTPKGPITKCEDGVGKQVAKFVGAILKCHASRVGGKLTDETGEDTCEGAAKTKFLATKTVGCTACTNLATIAAGVEALVDGNNNVVYCDAGTAFGGDDTGNIPTDAPKGPVTKCENAVGKGVSKLVGAIIKCHASRAVGKLVNEAAEETCEGAALTKFGTTKTVGCPACINIASIGAFVESAVDGANSLTYCEPAPAAFTKLSFTTTLGSTSCGGPSFSGFVAPVAPFSGEVDNSSNTKIGDLGKGCLYVGGGSAGTPANQIPDQAQSLFDLGTPSGGNVPLVAHAGAQGSCTKGAGPGKHCIGGAGGPIACTADSDCGGTAGSCALDANCTFGPPLPITGALPVCVINAIQTDASGTATPATGASTVDIPLSSRVYLTANATSPCPTCISGHCNAAWKDGSGNPSPNSGAACSPTGSQGTSLACGVPLGDYQGALAVDLNPLSTGPASLTNAGGIFCTSQTHAGAFHLTAGTTIKETGSPAGDITDGNPHASVLASVFCIPASLSAAINAVGDLPGPGATALGGNAQLLP